MAIFNSYVKLPEFKVLSRATSGLAELPEDAHKKSATANYCSSMFFFSYGVITHVW
jgi:hypothetical protein